MKRFRLIESMMVIAIVLILTSLVIPAPVAPAQSEQLAPIPALFHETVPATVQPQRWAHHRAHHHFMFHQSEIA